MPLFNQLAEQVKGRRGIEIGGPSKMLQGNGYCPVYPLLSGLDGVNFSNSTVWEGKIEEGNHFKYDIGGIGYQYISEGNDLSRIKDNTYELLISCNNLEHMANPIATLKEWERILADKGLMLLILPNKKSNFDHKRPDTTLEHLIDDYKQHVGEDDLTHLDEILTLHDLNRDPLAKSFENFKLRCMDNFNNRCMHHHVFSQQTLSGMAHFTGMKIKLSYSSPSDHFILLEVDKTAAS